MKIKSIQFTENQVPDNVTVEMSLPEALWIGLLSGRQSGTSPHISIYECLVGNFFNRYWEKGISEADGIFGPVEIPKIKYPNQKDLDYSRLLDKFNELKNSPMLLPELPANLRYKTISRCTSGEWYIQIENIEKSENHWSGHTTNLREAVLDSIKLSQKLPQELEELIIPYYMGEGKPKKVKMAKHILKWFESKGSLSWENNWLYLHYGDGYELDYQTKTFKPEDFVKAKEYFEKEIWG